MIDVLGTAVLALLLAGYLAQHYLPPPKPKVVGIDLGESIIDFKILMYMYWIPILFKCTKNSNNCKGFFDTFYKIYMIMVHKLIIRFKIIYVSPFIVSYKRIAIIFD